MPHPQRYDFSVPIRVAWGDMDALRHVNNVSYTRYFETARAEYLVHLHRRFDYKLPENVTMILTKLEFNYRGQVVFPADLEVSIGPTKITRRTLVLGCSMWDIKDNRCVADGLSHHMWIDMAAGRAISMPPEFDVVYEAYKSNLKED